MNIYKKLTSKTNLFSYLTLHIRDDEVHKLMRKYRAATFDVVFPYALTGVLLDVVA